MLRSTLVVSVVAAAIIVASSAHADTNVGGKKTSVASLTGPLTATAFPVDPPVLSVPLPSSYKSSKNILTITTSMRVFCSPGDVIASVVKVGTTNVEPVNGVFYGENSSTNDYQWVSRGWLLAPESQGGPAVAPGSTVDVYIQSNGASCSFEALTVEVRAEK